MTDPTITSPTPSPTSTPSLAHTPAPTPDIAKAEVEKARTALAKAKEAATKAQQASTKKKAEQATAVAALDALRKQRDDIVQKHEHAQVASETATEEADAHHTLSALAEAEAKLAELDLEVKLADADVANAPRNDPRAIEDAKSRKAAADARLAHETKLRDYHKLTAAASEATKTLAKIEEARKRDAAAAADRAKLDVMLADLAKKEKEREELKGKSSALEDDVRKLLDEANRLGKRLRPVP